MNFCITLLCLAVFLVSIDAQTTTSSTTTLSSPTTTPRPGGPTIPAGPSVPTTTPRPGGPTIPSGPSVPTTTPRPSGPSTPSGPTGPTTTARTVTTARPLCRGSVPQPACGGARDDGNTVGTDCAAKANPQMWYYNRRRRACRQMSYKGCGGNTNRFCTRRECQRKCRR